MTVKEEIEKIVERAWHEDCEVCDAEIFDLWNSCQDPGGCYIEFTEIFIDHIDEVFTASEIIDRDLSKFDKHKDYVMIDTDEIYTADTPEELGCSAEFIAVAILEQWISVSGLAKSDLGKACPRLVEIAKEAEIFYKLNEIGGLNKALEWYSQ